MFLGDSDQFRDVELQDVLQVLDPALEQVVLLQNVLNALKDELLLALGKVPKDGRLTVVGLLLQGVVDVCRVLGPAVDEGEGEADVVEVELFVELVGHASAKPVLVVAVGRRCCACSGNHVELIEGTPLIGQLLYGGIVLWPQFLVLACNRAVTQA